MLFPSSFSRSPNPVTVPSLLISVLLPLAMVPATEVSRLIFLSPVACCDVEGKESCRGIPTLLLCSSSLISKSILLSPVVCCDAEGKESCGGIAPSSPCLSSLISKLILPSLVVCCDAEGMESCRGIPSLSLCLCSSSLPGCCGAGELSSSLSSSIISVLLCFFQLPPSSANFRAHLLPLSECVRRVCSSICPCSSCSFLSWQSSLSSSFDSLFQYVISISHFHNSISSCVMRLQAALRFTNGMVSGHLLIATW
jgi:hypothetical protein